MKKVFLVLGILFTMLLTINCSKNETDYSQELLTKTSPSKFGPNEEAIIAQLQVELANLNEKYDVKPTRGRKWWKWLSVGLTDVVGWAAGGFWGSVAGSGTAYWLLFHCNFESIFDAFNGAPISFARNTRISSFPGTLTPDSTYTGVYSNVGIIHNQMLCNVFSDSLKLSNYSAGDSIQKMEIIIEEYEDIADTVITVTSQKKTLLARTFNSIAQALYESDTQEDFISALKSQSDNLRITPSIVDLLLLYIEGIDGAAEQKASYMNNALRVIDKSALSNLTKSEIENMMIIGHASYCLIEELGLEDCYY